MRSLILSKKFGKFDFQKCQKAVSTLLTVFLIFQIFGGVFLFVPLSQQVQAASDWLDGWDYRTPIEIDDNTEDLTDYQVQITLQGTNSSVANYVDFDKVLADGADIRFTDFDKITEIDFWIEEWVDTPSSESATIWLEIPSLLIAGIKTVYVYYGKSDASSGSNGDGTFELYNVSGVKGFWHMNENSWDGTLREITDEIGTNHGTANGGATTTVNGKFGRAGSFDGTEGYISTARNTTGDLWIKDINNPLFNGIFCSMWYLGPNDYHSYCGYSSATILHATSSDGENWIWDDANNPVLTGTVGEWDATLVQVPMVWKEGATWYMLYRGTDENIDLKRDIGLATSGDGINWTKDANNPVLSANTSGWEHSNGLGFDPWGIMKIDSTYYLWYNTINGTSSQVRATGLATSTDLVNWTRDANNPIFEGGRYCIHPFKYDNYYYMLISYWDCKIELYRDSNPTFYPGQREFLGSILECGDSGGWEDSYYDTPSVLTNDIYRNSFPDDNIWMYYTGWSGSVWQEGLAKYPLVSLLTLTSMPEEDPLDITDAITIEAWVKAQTMVGPYPEIIAKNPSYGLILYKNGGKYYLRGELNTDEGWHFTGYSTDVEIEYDQWYHVALVYSASTNIVNLYIDGSCVKSDSSTTSGNINSTSNHLFIPRITNPFNGIIDEVKIYNRALSGPSTNCTAESDNEICKIYNNYFEKNGNYYNVRKYTSIEPTATTTSAFCGYDKIFTGITNTISATDYVSYSSEPTVGNLVDMTITPASGSVDTSITTWNTSGTYYKKWTETGDGSTGNTAHTIGDLRANQYYQVKVDDSVIETLQADGAGQISFTYSGGYSDKEFEVEEIPLAPTIGSPAVLSSTSIRWNFTDNADNETGFRIYDNTDTLTASSATADLTYLDEIELSENTQYTGRYATAYNAYGNSASSSTASSVYTLIEAPAAISFDDIAVNTLTVSATGTLSNLTSGTSGLYFDETSGEEGGADSAWLQTNLYQGTDLSENTQYTYRVKARNGDSAETSYTATFSQYTLADTPTNLTSVANIASMDLSVDSLPNVTSDLSGYYFENTTKGTNSGWIQVSSWQNTGLSCGTSYSYTIKYRNGDGTETDTTSLTKFTHFCGTCVVFGAPVIAPVQADIPQDMEQEQELEQEIEYKGQGNKQEYIQAISTMTIVQVKQEIVGVLEKVIYLYTELITILRK